MQALTHKQNPYSTSKSSYVHQNTNSEVKRDYKENSGGRFRNHNTDASETGANVSLNNSPIFNFGQISIYPKSPIRLQPKLTINQPGDVYEQEADRVAEQVMRMPALALQRKYACGGSCTNCQQEHQKEEQMQTKAMEPNGLGQTEVPGIVHEVLRSPGQPLDSDARDFMQPRFGHNFSHVRVHTDERAAASAQAINARAYTIGNNIVFGVGQHTSKSRSGRELLAHELAHTIQQETGQSRSSSPYIKTSAQMADTNMDPGSAGDNRLFLSHNYAEQQIRRQLIPVKDSPVPIAGPYTGYKSFPPSPPVPTNKKSDPVKNKDAPAPVVTCTTPFKKATTFQGLIDLVRAAETKLNAAGITSTKDQIHALRGIYYGTTWSKDFAEEASTTRNEGFQRFTRPSQDPKTTVPPNVQPLLDCGLFMALQDSQDIVDGKRHLDFGHLIIALDARYDPALTSNVQYPVMMMNIDLGGSGTELVTWLGDLGGGAASLASKRATTPGTNVSSVFTGSDYGGSINLEGDIAGFIVASGTSPTALSAPTFAVGKGRFSDALQDYLFLGASPSSAWRDRATNFLKMYGATFDPSSKVLTNRSMLISTFSAKIQTFACNYLSSRVKDKHLTYATAKAAATHIIPAADEVATAFVDALDDSHLTGDKIEAKRFPTPKPAGSGACAQQLAAAGFLGVF